MVDAAKDVAGAVWLADLDLNGQPDLIAASETLGTALHRGRAADGDLVTWWPSTQCLAVLRSLSDHRR